MYIGDVFAYYDTNDNNSIDPSDVVDDDHFYLMLENCDYDNDGTLDCREV